MPRESAPSSSSRIEQTARECNIGGRDLRFGEIREQRMTLRKKNLRHSSHIIHAGEFRLSVFYQLFNGGCSLQIEKLLGRLKSVTFNRLPCATALHFSKYAHATERGLRSDR